MDTIADIYAAFGGAAEVGRVIGKSTEHAAMMRRRHSIPIEYWPTLLREANARNIEMTYETLVKMHTREKSPSSSPSHSAEEAGAG